MKILRLKLVNFIGINNGLGKSEIEINFPKESNHITMLLGKNGSGKSTILSQLTPFKDSFDDRKTLIIPGKEGRKEIDILHNNHVYKIIHICGKTSSSFISEDGIELNESGGVRTFEELIKQKFKLDKEYFKIGKIGSNTTNFIQFTTAQRKAYISVFVEEVQKYLDSYDVVSKKVKEQENQIKQISSDLKKFDSSEKILENINKTNNDLIGIEVDIQSLTKRDAEIDIEIKNINESLSKINYLESKSRLSDKEKILKRTTLLNESVSKNYPEITNENISNKIKEYMDDLNKFKNDISIDENNINSFTANKISLENEKTKINNKLKGLDKIDVEDYKNKISVLEKENESIKNTINKSSYYQKLYSKYDKLQTYLISFKNFMTSVLEEYRTLNSNTITPDKVNVELFFSKDFASQFGSYVKEVVSNITEQEKLLEEKQSLYSKKVSNLSKLDILEKRPIDCKINSCPFIADALLYKNLPNELSELDSTINSIKNSLSASKQKYDELSDLKITYSKIAKDYSQLLSRENIIYLHFISGSSITNLIKLSYNDLNKKYLDIVSETENIINSIDKYKTNKNALDILQEKYKNAESINDNRSYFTNRLEAINSSLNQLYESINKTNLVLNENRKSYSLLKNKVDELTKYEESVKDENSVRDEIKILQNTLETYESLSKNKQEKTYDSKLVKTKLKEQLLNRATLNENLTKYKAAELTVQNLNENLKKINETYNEYSTVKDALNPKSGIPLIFIQSYLEGTELIANELLNIAYNGKFEIKFIPTANDFFIQVRSGDNVIDDIKSASQGEIAMTTISISLALIERSLGEYNIVYLDEIDGPLDRDNRESFINIINKQIEKLNLEQIFVISHNNAFDNCPMNLILLPGSDSVCENSEFMKNKNIIYTYKE